MRAGHRHITTTYRSSQASCGLQNAGYDTHPLTFSFRPFGPRLQSQLMTIVARHDFNKPIWFDVTTSDPDGARKFYEALFGWNYDIGGQETGFYTMCMIGNSNAAGLGPNMPGQDMPPAWTVYFGVADADATVEKVKQAGGQVMVPVMDVLEYGRMAICTDSAGAVFGLWQPKLHVGATVIEQHGAMGWCEVNTRDASGTASFYGDVFGLKPQKLDDPNVTYFMLNQGEAPVGGVMEMTEAFGDMPPHWMPYFVVTDVDTSSQTVKDNGGKVLQEPFDTPYGRISVIMDPQGAALSIITPPAG